MSPSNPADPASLLGSSGASKGNESSYSDFDYRHPTENAHLEIGRYMRALWVGPMPGGRPLRLWLYKSSVAVRTWILAKIQNDKPVTISKPNTSDSDSTDDEEPSIGLAKLKLYDHKYLEKLFKDVLESDRWPKDADKYIQLLRTHSDSF